MDTQQKINFDRAQLERIYQLLRAKGCRGTAGHLNYESFMNRDRKVERLEERQMTESMLIGGVRALGKIKRPMFGYED
jgi:hypothetical protein